MASSKRHKCTMAQINMALLTAHARICHRRRNTFPFPFIVLTAAHVFYGHGISTVRVEAEGVGDRYDEV